MKKMASLFLVGVIGLSAVEWENTKVSENSLCYNLFPLLCLDNNDHARILFITFDEENELGWLNLAYDTGSEWITKEVTQLSTFLLYFLDSPINIYSLDVDSKGNTWVAFIDYDETSEALQLCMACDTGVGSSFVIDTLTQDAFWQLQVVLQLDSEDQPKLVYLEVDPEGESFELRYGWLEGGELASEPITEFSNDYTILPLDMVIDKADMPHVFYTDLDEEYDLYLSHASVSSQYVAIWDSEQVSDSVAALPSAAFDASGSLAVAYCTGDDMDKIGFSRKETGGWEEVVVAQPGEIEEVFQGPSLDFNSTGTPYIVHMEYDTDWNYDLWLYYRSSQGWDKERITNILEDYEVPGIGHFFSVDKEGYGHLAYTLYSAYNETYDIYYAHSLEPLPSPGMVEERPQDEILELRVSNSLVYFSLSQPSPIHLSLYDVTGSRVKEIASGPYSTGEHSIPLNTAGLAAGVYFVRLESCKTSASVKYVKTK